MFTSNTVEVSVLDSDRAKNIYQYDDEKSAILKYVLNFKMNYKEQESVIDKIFVQYFKEEEVLGNLYMSKQSLTDLAQRGFLGSHSHHHYPLGLLPLDTIKSEILSSKKILEEITDSKIELIAYPFGTREACTEDVAEIAKEEGFKFGFTTSRGNNVGLENPLLLNRFDCNDLLGGK